MVVKDEKSKLIVYISMTLDGYITDKDESIGYLSEYNSEDYDYDSFLNTIDTVIVGKNTYNKVIEMGFEYPHKNKDVYIISESIINNIGNFKLYSGSLKKLVVKLKKSSLKNIYCDGGSHIISQLLSDNLVDEIIVTIIPVLLNGGLKLFTGSYNAAKLKHLKTRTFLNGLVQNHYTVIK